MIDFGFETAANGGKYTNAWFHVKQESYLIFHISGCAEANIALTKHLYQTDNNAHEIWIDWMGKTVIQNLVTKEKLATEDTPGILECGVSYSIQHWF